MRRALTICAVALALGSLLATPAFAGKPSSGGTSGSSYTVTVSPAGPYTFGEDVYASTNVPQSLSPYISLSCYVNGTLVLGSTHAGFSSGWYYNWPFQLGPSQSWSSGPADCKMAVTHTASKKTVTDASVSFHVNG